MNYSGLVVLVVEDDPDDLELILSAFRKARITNPIEVCQENDVGAERKDM